MISTHTIRTVARYEMRTLLRGWFFRIFAGLSIFSLGIFNIAVFVEASGAPWLYRALPASIPYANLIILNLGQAIVAVFLASEFLKQDKKNDTVEVIYARSMTNAEYILGKALGVLAVFLVLNIIILLLGIGFSFLSSDSSRSILTYFYYPLLISLPTLVFILGLSFFLMVTIKNQAITFILLLGYIALSIFYLNTKFFHLLDFIAYNVPMMHSTIGGFGNINEILLHRSIYLFLGIGFVFFTVFKLSRLPQAKKLSSLPLYLAILFIGLGGFAMKKYLDIKQGNLSTKQSMINVNNTYVDYPKVTIDSCQIELEHQKTKILVTANLTAINKSSQKIDILILSLNPFLHISSAKLDGKDLEVNRDLQVIKLVCTKSILPDEKHQIVLRYKGSIDENTHFLDQDLEDYEDNFSFEIFRLRKRYAYLNEDFVCLTSESLWYPISGVGYASNNPTLHLPDFTNFTLKVKTSDKLVAVSQGEVTKPEAGIYQFKPEYPLPKISLLIAEYKKYAIEIDSVEYNLYTKEGNQYFEEHFKEFTDSLPHLIKELKNEYETFIGLDYPFKRFILAEVPIHFALDKHIWSVSSDAVQPELTFVLEKGVMMEETDFKKRKIREEDRMKQNNEEILPKELQARIFKRCIRGNFMATPAEWYHADVVDRNTFVLFPHYYTFTTQLHSEKWAILNMALEAYLKERNVNTQAATRWWREGINKGERVNMELKQASLRHLIENGIEKTENEDERVNLNDLILAKGEYLFSLFRARYGEEKFNRALNNFVKNHRHTTFSYTELETLFTSSFGDSISNDLENWLNKPQLPGFIVKDIQNYKVKEGEFIKYQIRFKVSNPGKVDGLVTVFVEMNDQNNRNNREFGDLDDVDFSKKIFIPADSAKEIGLVFPNEPARMRIFTHISENLPNNLNFDFSSFEELKKIPALDTVIAFPLFKSLRESNEIIVDNEDEGFEIIEISNQSYLKSLIKKENRQRYQYTPIRYWNPPGSWKAVLRSEFYGKYARSAEYTKTGDGSRKAVWKAPINETGHYDVYCYLAKIDFGRHSEKERLNYNFKIFHTDGVEEISLFETDIESGWNYLGTFHISSSTARVELTNKSIGKMLFADAIKWVKSK